MSRSSGDDLVDADGKADAIAGRALRAGTSSKTLAEATAHMGRIAGQMSAMAESLAAEAHAYQALGLQLDMIELRLNALTELAASWVSDARAIRGRAGGEARARVLEQCARDLRRAVGLGT